MKLLIAVGAFWLSSMFINSAEGECCWVVSQTGMAGIGDNSHESHLYGKCRDGSKPHLNAGYCGYGPCNIFGCNCDGGCLGKKSDENGNGYAVHFYLNIILFKAMSSMILKYFSAYCQGFHRCGFEW